jgi:hypothetical protein
MCVCDPFIILRFIHLCHYSCFSMPNPYFAHYHSSMPPPKGPPQLAGAVKRTSSGKNANDRASANTNQVETSQRRPSHSADEAQSVRNTPDGPFPSSPFPTGEVWNALCRVVKHSIDNDCSIEDVMNWFKQAESKGLKSLVTQFLTTSI